MLYWKGEKFRIRKLLEHPEIMTQGKTLEEFEKNIKEAYMFIFCYVVFFEKSISYKLSISPFLVN